MCAHAVRAPALRLPSRHQVADEIWVLGKNAAGKGSVTRWGKDFAAYRKVALGERATLGDD